MTCCNLGFGTSRVISERVNNVPRVRIETGMPKATIGTSPVDPTAPKKKNDDVIIQLHNAEGAAVLVRAITRLYPELDPYYVHCA